MPNPVERGRRAAGAGDAMNKFFIVGCPRSGTTMLQQALNRHPRVVIPPETVFFVSFFGRTLRWQRNHVDRLRNDLRIDLPYPEQRVASPAAARAYYDDLARRYLTRLARPGVTHFGDKSPEHFQRVRTIQRVFPGAKFIAIYRDGRDVALSLSKVPWMHPDVCVTFCVWLYYYRLLRKLRAAGLPNAMVLKYEDLVADPARELRRVAAFLELPYEPVMATGAGNAEGIPGWEYAWKSRAMEGISADRAGVWQRELTADQIARIEFLGGRALAALGYPLHGARPGRSPVWFVPPLAGKIFAWRLRKNLRVAAAEYLGWRMPQPAPAVRLAGPD